MYHSIFSRVLLRYCTSVCGRIELKPGHKSQRPFTHRSCPIPFSPYSSGRTRVYAGDGAVRSEKQIECPEECDVLVLGGGAVGSSVAYHLLQRARRDLRVVVVEQDPAYTKASTVLSLGGIRQQYTVKENIQLSLYGAEFLRNASSLLAVEGQEPPDVQFRPQGYLLLAPEDKVELLRENFRLQVETGAKVQFSTATQLKAKYPWLNITGVGAGVEGLENEGRFDPWGLLSGLRRKATSLGAEYVRGKICGLNKRDQGEGAPAALTSAEIHFPCGTRRSIAFKRVVLACGAWSGQVAALAGIGAGEGALAMPLHIYPRKRYVYIVHVPGLPGANTPIFIDISGTYFKREGLNTHLYTVGKSPNEEQEPSVDDLEIDYEFFENEVWPLLAERVPIFENLKGAWAGYYDYHTLDQNPIIGPHPIYTNLFIVAGFSGHGAQHAAGAGRATAEYILEGKFCTIDLNRFCFERVLSGEAVREKNVI
ncbi:FAD-dependent oxidoreductase domain-containing protein 1-like isoform X2 [Penaeus japonicus]|uniref:FAD-dependent oxidoreductase domain-containing protein 1-like isoform X2 n=1 Tax=Penaeus japonicus TaxID=27405 RepID=UPI001C710014|nr:FAD-dependent oxidoreductase domain-containing protein 1-like isoform X2 [Penaeus japonicus]